MLQQYWSGLPAWFRGELLPGTVGMFQCMRLASKALTAATSGDRTMLMAGRELLLAAWEDDLLNGDLARQVLSLDQQVPWLAPETKTVLQQLAGAFTRPDNLRYFERLAQQGEYDKIQVYLDSERAKAPDNCYWLQQVVAVGELAGALEWALQHVQQQWPAPLASCIPLQRMVEAHLLTALGRYEAVLAVPANATSVAAGSAQVLAERRAHCLWMTGQRDAAHALWRQMLALRPWNVNMLLRLYDSLMGHDGVAGKFAELGRTAALLYSWNKADDLDKALECLAPSATDLCRIVALNNGSTDDTGSVIDAWAQRLGERMQAIHLPVNVGAPAARNWLKNLPEMAETEYIAYLDDDAMLPPDWVQHMNRAVAVCPQASVWGGKILDYHAPHIVQSADLHLTMATGTEEEIDSAFSPIRAHAVPFNVTDIHAQVSDAGRFAYIRPCISVTGCCHLFRTADLMACGDFSLSLSPSQYDDLEHDLRLAAQQKYCAYTGFLAVRHMKRTGKASRMSAGQFGNGLGNKYKLHSLYSREAIEQMMQFETAVLEQDLLFKAGQLDSMDPVEQSLRG